MHFVYTILALFFILTVVSASAQETSSVKLFPSDDAYVVGDLVDPGDTRGIMSSNTGTEESLVLVTSLNAENLSGEIISVIYLKFDLSGQEIDKIENAQLKLLTKETLLPNGPKNIVLTFIPDDNWDENQITYLQRPPFSTTLASTNIVSDSIVWNYWDISEVVKQNQDSEISLALIFELGAENVGESVVFHSKESGSQFAPYLELSFSSSPIGPMPQAENDSDYTFYIITIGAVVAAFFVGMQISKRKLPSTIQNTKQQTKKQCQSCSRMLPDYYKFCPACGQAFS